MFQIALTGSVLVGLDEKERLLGDEDRESIVISIKRKPVPEKKKKLEQLEETLDDGADNKVQNDIEQKVKKKKKKKSKVPQQENVVAVQSGQENGVKQGQDKEGESEETGYESEEGRAGMCNKDAAVSVYVCLC